MSKRSQSLALAGMLLELLGNTAGCALFQAKVRQDVYRGQTEDGRMEVNLVREAQVDAIQKSPDYNYEKLILSVTVDDNCTSHVVAHRELPSQDKGGYSLGELGGRTDANRERIWIVDKESGRVIAAYERGSNAVTGIEQKPPTWATVDGGVPLNEATPSVHEE